MSDATWSIKGPHVVNCKPSRLVLAASRPYSKGADQPRDPRRAPAPP